MNSVPVRKQAQKRRFSSRMHVGCGKQYNYSAKWAFEIPEEKFSDSQQVFLKNKCLLIAFLLAYFQNLSFETLGQDKHYHILCGLRSRVKQARENAFLLLESKLNDLFSVTKVQKTGPYEIRSTFKLLHKTYKCQFFVFTGLMNCIQLAHTYPQEYNDELMPIFLLQPNLEPGHLIFITNLNYYFGSVRSFCLACKQLFKRRYNSHMCKNKAYCFTCRKHVQTENTYLHSSLKQLFCDRNLIAKQAILKCEICNLPVYSDRCKSNHKKICYGSGSFGYFFDCCQKFIANISTIKLKLNHKCTDPPTCGICFKPKETDHLCRLRFERFQKDCPRLGFICIDFFTNTVVDDCAPCMAILLREDVERCHFTTYIIKHDKTTKTSNFVKKYLPEDLKQRPFQHKKIKHSSVLCTNIKKMLETKTLGTDCVSKLLPLILDFNFTCTTYIVQDSDSFMLLHLMKAFVANGICPNICRKGKNIILLDIPELSIRFLNSNNYLIGNEYEIAEQFEIAFTPMYFPYKYLTPENLNFKGTIPDLQFFHVFGDDIKTVESKVKFFNARKDLTWSLQDELESIGLQKLFLLAETMLDFCIECFNIQDSFMCKVKHQYVHPFAKPVCTLGSFVFKFYKIYFLNDFDIYTVNHEYGAPMRQVSQLEYEFVSYQEFCLKGEKCMSAFNNKNGQKYFKHCIPDLYSLTSNEAYFLNGDYYHAHYNDCPNNKNKTAESRHPFGGTYKDQNEKFYSKLTNLMEKYPEINKAHVIYECQFQEMKKSPNFKLFYDNHYIPHPLKRLCPRHTVRGGLSEVYAFKWSKVQFPGENFYSVDVNGLYSYCAVNFPYMVGKYDVLIGDDVNRLKISNERFFLDNQQIMGSILLTILAPTSLLHPFLPYRKKNKTVTLALCRECAENESFDCNHSDNLRAFTATYMLSEIEFALTLGYKILHIHEVHFYTKSEFILRDFVLKLNCFKIKATDCFKNCDSLHKKLKTCEIINSKMGLQNPDMITIDNVQPNLRKRNFYKLLCNSLFGKFIQHSNRSKLNYICDQEQLQNLFYSGALIEDFFCPNEKLCIMNTKVDERKIPCNRAQNLYIGSQITAYSREVIYKQLMEVQQIEGARIYQIDCDSLSFSLPLGTDCCLNVSPSLGDFKHVYSGEIVGFYSLGQKQYCINYKSCDQVKSSFKISGLSLKTRHGSDDLTENSFESFLNNVVKGISSSKVFNQEMKRTDFKKFSVLTYQQKYTLTNNLSKKRFVNIFDDRLATYPFGFKV